VFHVGGVSGIGGPWKHYYEINTLGTHHVVDGCRAHGVGRLVFTSSPSVTFDGRDQRGVDESAPYAARWLSSYAHSKALAEQHVLAASDAAGLLTCALRPHLIWGPRDRQLLPRLLARAAAGRLCRVGDGSNLIDTVYVENAAEAHLLAAEALTPGSPVAGRAYFISQGEPVNCWQWVDSLVALAGLPRIRKSRSLRTAWAIGAALELLYRVFRPQAEPPMTRFLAAQMARCHYFDVRRACEDFGYRARISMAEGMQRLAASWQRQAAESALPGG
jgi:nucleoside-diphosphate-sugar epimerase